MKGLTADRSDVIELTRQLIGFDTTNPPGCEGVCAAAVNSWLAAVGLDSATMYFDEGRANLIARLPGRTGSRPLVLTGHLDTVPFGHASWARPPLSGEVHDGRVHGRGASDMKSGVAAMLVAFAEAASLQLNRGVTLILTAGEETGCLGAMALRKAGVLEPASGILIGEPTGNRVSLGHKGCFCVTASFRGTTAHSSMPHLGRNAVYDAARAVGRIEAYRFAQGDDGRLGPPSVNVGVFRGGLNFNSVPDSAEFTVDVRTNSLMPHEQLMRELEAVAGEARLSPMVDMPAVATAADDEFACAVSDAAARVLGYEAGRPGPAMPFFTDGSVLGPAQAAPVVILGPGDTELAHQTDESCSVEAIEDATAIYRELIEAWCG
jgi:succinyl-diaminopimelate desuccinylase